MKVAVLGIGGMGVTVVRHLKKSDLVDTIVGYDVSIERIEKVQKEEEIECTARLEDILEDTDIPLVFVTASNDAHYELVDASLEAGKAIMCEKPIATTVEHARDMVEKSEKLNAFLQIGFELRYSKLYTTVKDWIDQGILGEVVNCHCFYIVSEFHHKGSWRNKKETGGSMFGEKLSHYVDLPRWWIGSQVKQVASFCAPNIIPYFEVHDNYHTTYTFESGAVSHLTFMMGPAATFGGDPLQNVVSQQKGDGHNLKYLVTGTKGCVETDVFGRTLKRWEFSDTPKCQTSELVETLTWDESEDHFYFHNTHDQTLDIVKRVHEGKPPMTPARDAFDTMRLVFAADEAADTKKTVNL